jgi:hypothetical protein
MKEGKMDKFSIAVNNNRDGVKMSFQCSNETARKDFVELSKLFIAKIEKIKVEISN